jgi:hypothetical protein
MRAIVIRRPRRGSADHGGLSRNDCHASAAAAFAISRGGGAVAHDTGTCATRAPVSSRRRGRGRSEHHVTGRHGERSSTGVLCHLDFTLRETGGRSATVSS